ncbi:MAG: type II toxin-antitoxin system PemK/MazF family toxin [candidate division NC10 bacterium]|nr:type II toxin-antitoxin system PemK/MazF family toxin [candidate division NC10 bacterium]
MGVSPRSSRAGGVVGEQAELIGSPGLPLCDPPTPRSPDVRGLRPTTTVEQCRIAHVVHRRAGLRWPHQAGQGQHLPCKLPVGKDSPEGREAGLRLDSVVDCQTLATVPREEIVRRLGRFPAEIMRRVDQALRDALGLG